MVGVISGTPRVWPGAAGLEQVNHLIGADGMELRGEEAGEEVAGMMVEYLIGQRLIEVIEDNAVGGLDQVVKLHAAHAVGLDGHQRELHWITLAQVRLEDGEHFTGSGRAEAA